MSGLPASGCVSRAGCGGVVGADALCSFFSFRVAAAFRAAALRFLVRAAFLPAALNRRVLAAFLPAARSFLVLAAFFAAALRFAIVSPLQFGAHMITHRACISTQPLSGMGSHLRLSQDGQ